MSHGRRLVGMCGKVVQLGDSVMRALCHSLFSQAIRRQPANSAPLKMRHLDRTLSAAKG
jgi:hypothetical protein